MISMELIVRKIILQWFAKVAHNIELPFILKLTSSDQESVHAAVQSEIKSQLEVKNKQFNLR